MNLSLLYRGPLTSCNYACGYCPFAKRAESKARLAHDQSSLWRFIDWLRAESTHRWRILFTPWGEALVRTWYREAIAELTHVPHVDSAAVQTNLSCGLDWLSDCRSDRLSFWATYHPTEVDRPAFLLKVEAVRNSGATISVGAVGVPEFAEEISSLRRELPPEIYLWINAQQPRRRAYTADEVSFFSAIDPLFELTASRHRSFEEPCRTGEQVFTVDGEGAMRRCHFVEEIIGNIYEPGWEDALRPRTCPNRFCNCYLGLAHLKPLALERVFGEGAIGRVLPVHGVDVSEQ